MPSRSRLLRRHRRREHGQHEPVGRLARPEPAEPVGRQDVAEPRRAAAHAAGADPPRKGCATGVPSTRGEVNVTMPFALGWMPVPAFAVSRPLFWMSSWICARDAPLKGMRPRNSTGFAPFVCPSAHAFVVAERRTEECRE